MNIKEQKIKSVTVFADNKAQVIKEVKVTKGLNKMEIKNFLNFN